ncbi:nudix hydrolase 20, chloroplastic [Plakobranchus ocellatus]|uniref:Nudix hydrolase 20, chloroplastic n=1 Tax=Plakobranchus ocellatus TaxID=259542 RepID=A0AAV4DFH3_9GAST|nr:nudix hydrolase 20, chloroplastic [Plakobranchus ocellatus]
MTFNLLSQLTDRSMYKEDEDEGSPVDDVGDYIDDESDVDLDVEEGEVTKMKLLYTETPSSKDASIILEKNASRHSAFKDRICAGGLAAGMGILECAKKECQEEASVSDKLLERLKPVGCVSYFYEDERGLQPESQFVFDLELPDDFTPIQTEMVGGNFKPNCACVCLDFLIRHSFFDFDADPNILYYIEQMHAPLQSMYV